MFRIRNLSRPAAQGTSVDAIADRVTVQHRLGLHLGRFNNEVDELPRMSWCPTQPGVDLVGEGHHCASRPAAKPVHWQAKLRFIPLNRPDPRPT